MLRPLNCQCGRRRGRWSIALMAILATALAAAGCTGSTGPAASPAHASSTSPTPSPSSGASAGLAPLVLSSVAASQAGIPVERRAAPDGTRLTGKNAATLDLCRAHYPSEAKRTARDQVDYLDIGAGTNIASEEAVTYSAGGAAAAYTEVTRAAKACPKTVAEGSATVSKVTIAPVSSALVASQLTITQRVTSRQPTFWSAAIYQYDGNTFIGIYTYLPTRSTALRYASSLAALVAKRLTTSIGTTV
jgi:hypothetical protein